MREAGWNREMEVVGPALKALLAIVLLDGGWWSLKLWSWSFVPLVKARRAIGFAWRSAEAPLRRAERAASWAMEFMMKADGIGDGEWRLRS